MAEWHLKDLSEALERNGWRLEAEHEGDGYRISASWELVRDGNVAIFLDFEGLDDMRTLAVDHSYACHLRGDSRIGLYFSKKGDKKSANRASWKAALKEFIDSRSHSLGTIHGSSISRKEIDKT